MKEPQENQEIDHLFRKRFENYESTPNIETRSEIFSKIAMSEKRIGKIAFLKYGIAASILLACVFSILFLYFLRPAKTKQTIAVVEMQKDRKNSTTNDSILHSEKKIQDIPKHKQSSAEISAIVNPDNTKRVIDKKSENAITIVSGTEKKEIVLPDNSHIALDAHSSIVYQSDFAKERKVELKGDAFFSIQKKHGKNFRVITGTSVVEVLGTTFYVHASESSIQNVSVMEGKISFYRTGQENKKIQLSTGESGFFNNKNMPEKLPNQNNQERLDGKELVFENAALSDVITRLNAYFSEYIEVANKEILNCTYSGSFAKPKKIEEVLDVLTVALGLSYSRDKANIVLSGDGCK